MPIYAYKCESCGHRQDVLQRVSDAVLTTCPACGASSFVKQVTAAGFQLKGSGWYVTDFRGGAADKADKSADKGADKGADKTEAKPADAAAAAPAPAAAPAASSPAGDKPSSSTPDAA